MEYAAIILLDSSILIDYFRKTAKERTAYYKLVSSGEALGISTLVEYEVLAGNRPEVVAFWNELLATMRRYDLTSEVVRTAVDIHRSLKAASKLIPAVDLLIAATAVHHQLPLATLNRSHFERVNGLRLTELQ